MQRFLAIVALGCSASSEPATTPTSETGTDTAIVDSAATDSAVGDTAPVKLAWSKVSLPEDSFNVQVIRARAPNDVWLSGSGMTKKGVARYNGTTWEVDTIGGWMFAPDDLFRTSATEGWAAGGRPGEIWRRAPTWSKSTAFTSNAIDCVIGIGSEVYACGGSSGIGSDAPIHRFDGSTWSPFPTGSDDRVYSMYGASKDDLWAGTHNGLLHYVGGSWTKVRTTGYFPKMIGFAANDVWILQADVTRVLHWNGTTLDETTVRDDYLVSQIWGSSSKDMWAVGPAVFSHYDGTSWKDASTEPGAPKDGVAIGGSGPTDVWVASYQRLDHLSPVP